MGVIVVEVSGPNRPVVLLTQLAGLLVSTDVGLSVLLLVQGFRPVETTPMVPLLFAVAVPDNTREKFGDVRL